MIPIEQTILDYSEREFGPRARKLLLHRLPFRIEVRGYARDLLAAHLFNGQLVDAPKLGLIPELRTLLAAVMMAKGAQQLVSYEVEPEAIVVSVGIASG